MSYSVRRFCRSVLMIMLALGIPGLSLTGCGGGSGGGSSDKGGFQTLSPRPMISTGYQHILALKSDGAVYAWGYNDNGQLGNGTSGDSYNFNPAKVEGLPRIAAIAAGHSHNLALACDGTVWAWGANQYGQLGNGTVLNSAAPVKVSGLANIIAIAAGENHSLALTFDGQVFAWGNNAFGQLGDGTCNDKNIPQAVSGFNGRVIAIAGGSNHNIALVSGGTLWAWGYNNRGQLGLGSTVDAIKPTQINSVNNVTAIAAGGDHSLAQKSDGGLISWGSNGQGELGDNTTMDRSIPVTVSKSAGFTNIKYISAGSGHNLVILENGTVWGWGENNTACLTGGAATDSYLPAPREVFPSTLSDIISVAAGNQVSFALDNNGTLWSWGYNQEGMLGADPKTEAERAAPGKVTGF